MPGEVFDKDRFKEEVSSMEPSRPWMTFDAECSLLRSALKTYGAQIKDMMGHSYFAQPPEAARDFGEMKANIMLAYRHVEDALMRLGKAIQAYDGGKTVYDPKDAARIAKEKLMAEVTKLKEQR